MLSRSQATTMYVIATPTACSFIHSHPTRTCEPRVPSWLTPSPNRPQSLAALALFSSCSSVAAASCACLLAPPTPAGDAGRRPPPPPLGQGVVSLILPLSLVAALRPFPSLPQDFGSHLRLCPPPPC